MSAAELRQAAETLRARAQAAAKRSPAPWTRGGYKDCSCCPEAPLLDGEGDAIVDAWQIGTAEADYIATMHPGVGLALADWLDDAATWEGAPGTVNHDMRAHDIARLINGGAA